MTFATVPPSPAERLAGLIEGLCVAVAAHGARGLLTVPLLLLLWSRLSRMAQRARRLAKRMAAGAALGSRRSNAAPRSTPSPPYIRLPRGVLWLVRVVPGTASGAATLQFLLDQPDMAEMAAFPPMRRLLRPLCRMLGVRPPARRSAPPEAVAPIARAIEPPNPPPEPSQSNSPKFGAPASPRPVIPRNAV